MTVFGSGVTSIRPLMVNVSALPWLSVTVNDTSNVPACM